MLSSQRCFENDDLVQLQSVFAAACERLRIGWDRAALREHVANLVMSMACHGERDPEVIQSRVVLQLER